ncbi:Tyrosyl-tRNA synthetase [uncultured virus]|nr:Tyrosyl-tRNA synthetase [uncultured virus]
MQAVDENYVGQTALGVQADMELGGLDQRKIFCFSYEWDHKNEEGKISYLMNPIISLSKSGKMSASDVNEKITFEDSEDEIITKIKEAFCCDGDPAMKSS